MWGRGVIRNEELGRKKKAGRGSKGKSSSVARRSGMGGRGMGLEEKEAMKLKNIFKRI